MIEDNGLVFTNLNGVRNVFNNNTWPLKTFEVEPNFRGTRIDRMEEPGEWPTRTVPGALLIHTGGDVVCDTPENYIAQTIGCVNTLVPAGIVELERSMGTLRLKYYGLEWLVADCTIDGYSFPKEALYPSVGPWMITYRIFAGYMVGLASGRFYSLA